MEFLHEGEFWVLVAAVIFVALVGRKVGRAVTSGLDARAARIRGELDEARRLREEAEKLVAEYRAKQEAATAEAAAIVAHATAEAERIAAQSARDLELSLERRQRLAEERIAQAVDVAIAAAREVIAAEINERRGAVLLDDAIVALPERLR
jgi:F-type H+-transporting ATPase subunit b